ncbi:YqcI/YcgG family protein [Halorubrum sp. DTA46]|uniref:YqcI/YcgG family protein n=1 Tax=Halorubrum sp. DTA46 TaxID=3402162 RepID=UPI003AAF492F
MNEPGTEGVLLDQEALHDRLGDAPDWLQAHYRTFRESMLGERDGSPFPCYFGIEVEREGELLYAACESTTDPVALLRFRDVLLEYLDTYADHADRAPLAVFFRPPDDEPGEAHYHERLWHVLEFLHVHDPEPWPESIPTDPDDPHWEFCFGGEPLFPTSRAPFYDERKSRYSPIGLEITFQPRAVFEGLTADTEAGQHAREVIQSRMAEYDGVCPHADLGNWGAEGDREWTQYLFREDDDASPDACPLRPTREHPKAPEALLERGAWRRLADRRALGTESPGVTTGLGDD